MKNLTQTQRDFFNHVHEDFSDYGIKYSPVVSKKLKHMAIGAILFFFCGIAGYAVWTSIQGGR